MSTTSSPLSLPAVGLHCIRSTETHAAVPDHPPLRHSLSQPPNSTHTHTHTHTHTLTHSHTHTLTHTHTHTHSHTHTLTHAYTHTHTRTHTHTHIHTHTHTYTHTHTHTRARTHTHAHACVPFAHSQAALRKQVDAEWATLRGASRLHARTRFAKACRECPTFGCRTWLARYVVRIHRHCSFSDSHCRALAFIPMTHAVGCVHHGGVFARAAVHYHHCYESRAAVCYPHHQCASSDSFLDRALPTSQLVSHIDAEPNPIRCNIERSLLAFRLY
jgi:hypothetical protein